LQCLIKSIDAEETRNITHAYLVLSRLCTVPDMSRFQLIDSDHNLDDNDKHMVEVVQEGEASSSTGPHRMRITSGGQVAGYVNFALSFLKVCLKHTQGFN
jgi:hypothetical protein